MIRSRPFFLRPSGPIIALAFMTAMQPQAFAGGATPALQRDLLGNLTGNLADVDKVQYLEPGTGYVDCPDVLYVPVGTTVTFKALAPEGQTFPANSPTWSGPGGSLGTGNTVTVTFPTVSNSLDEFQVVRSRCKSWKKVKVIVFDFSAEMKPDDDFDGRSTTEVGIGETGTLTYKTQPAGDGDTPIAANLLGGLEWENEEGDVEINNSAAQDGGGTWIAGTTEGTLKAGIKLQSGPGAGSTRTASKTAVIPSGVTVLKLATAAIPNEEHYVDTVSAGLNAVFYLTPSNVAFPTITVQEGCAAPAVTGTWLTTKTTYSSCATAGGCTAVAPAWIWLTDSYHCPGSAMPMWLSGGKLSSIDKADPGLKPFSVAPFNTVKPWVQTVDQIYMGAYTPALLPGTAGSGYGNGTFTWLIPWSWIAPTGASGSLGTIKHLFTCYGGTPAAGATPAGGDSIMAKGAATTSLMKLSAPTTSKAF